MHRNVLAEQKCPQCLSLRTSLGLNGQHACVCVSVPQDLMESDSITLDWMFRYSLINDIVKVKTCLCGLGVGLQKTHVNEKV